MTPSIHSWMTAWLPAGSGGLRVDFDFGALAIRGLNRLGPRIVNPAPVEKMRREGASLIRIKPARGIAREDSIMARSIPISLESTPSIEIDAALVAGRFGLTVPAFQRLLEDRKITQLCERGTGPDKGLYRASFYYRGKRVRLVVDAQGRPVTDAGAD
ncbi:MAG TPA: DUF6522 family protein [bacterium]|nr:DUF6522 family protein [bacterium]